MARKHPETVIVAIEALTRANVNAAEIQRKLAAGEVPEIAPYEMSRRTIQHHAARARRQLDPLPDDTIEAVDALEQDFLRIALRELGKLRVKQRAGDLTAKDARLIREWHKTAAQIRAEQRKQRAPSSRHQDARRAGEGPSKHDAQPSTIFERIGQASSGGNGDQASARETTT